MAFRSLILTTLVFAFWPTACRYTDPNAPVVEAKPEEPPLPPEKAQPKDEPAPATDNGPPESAVPERATTGACDDRACTASEDCCKGFVCGFDPERSRVQRYCQPQ